MVLGNDFYYRILSFGDITVPIRCSSPVVTKETTATEKSQGMLALALSQDRQYLAMSELGEKGTITVYELYEDYIRKRKVLSGEETPVQEFVSIAFSHDSQYLIGQSGEPDWTLFLWIWQRQKLMYTIKTGGPTTPIYKVSFNPHDHNQICVCGNGVFKLFSYVERALKQTNTQKQEPLNYLSHDWVSENQVIVGSDTGQLLLFKHEALQWKTNLGTTHDSERTVEKQEPGEICVTAIATNLKGFACSAGPGMVYLFQMTKEKDGYNKIREIQIPEDPCCTDPSQAQKQEIVSLCFSPSQKNLAACTDRGQLYRINLTLEKEKPHFEFLSHSFHYGAVTGLSTCIQKPLLATCSLDRSVRIWNFETNTLEFSKAFTEVPRSIALHPTGLSMLVLFFKKLTWLNLLIDDCRTFKEFSLSGCTECAFSNGGHMFAVVHGTTIHLYSTMTSENILNLQGHKKNVRFIIWSEDDSRLVSRDADGAVYEWNIHSSKLESEIVHKSYMYTSVAVSPDAKTIFVMGTDFTLKQIQETKILSEVPTGDVTYTTITVSRSGKVLFCGTSVGTVMIISCPLFEPKNLFQYQGRGHTAPITKICVTYDDQFLLTTSEDGSVLIWRITWNSYYQKKDSELCYLEEIFITKSDLEKKNRLMKDLQIKVKELKIENRFQLRLKDIEHERDTRIATEKYTQEIDCLKKENEALVAEKKRFEVFHNESIEAIAEKSSKDLKIIQADTFRKLTKEYEMSHMLQLKSQQKLDKYEKKLQKSEESHKRELENLMKRYESKLQENILKLTESEAVSHQQKREFEDIKKMIEQDADKEIMVIRCKYEQKLRKEKDIAMEYRDETGIMRKKASHVQKEMDHKSAEIEKLKLELQKRQNVIAGLNKDISSYKRQIKLRNNNIDEKEKCITKLRKMITDLEKSKFLMDYKNKELLNKIEPNERTIETMRERIQEMESELEETERQNSQMELTISELKLRLKATDTDKRQEMQRACDIDMRMQRLKSDLQHCVEFIQDPKKLKDGILMLHKNYLESSDLECIHRQDAELQANAHQIFFEREDMARNALCAVKSKMARDADMHQTYTFRMMKENIALMTEINSLRYKLILFEDQLQACTTFLELNQMEKKSQEEESKIVTSTPLPWFKEVEEPTGATLSLEEAGELQSPSASTKAQAETSPPGCPAKKQVSTSIQQLHMAT